MKTVLILTVLLILNSMIFPQVTKDYQGFFIQVQQSEVIEDNKSNK